MHAEEVLPRAGWRVALLLPVVFVIFLLSFYSPLSAKSINNVFYIFIALPCAAWLLAKPQALVVVGREFFWIFCALAGMVGFSAADFSDLKKFFYLALLFAFCLYLEGKGWMERCFLWFAMLSTAIFLFVLCEWLWNGVAGAVWTRYQMFFGADLNPVYWGLSIVSAWVYLWVFHGQDALLRWSRVGFAVGLVFFNAMVLVCVTAFQARSALLGYLVFFVFYVLRGRLFVPAVLLMVCAAAVAYFAGWADLLLQRGSSYRLDIWRDALDRVINECGIWLGCGADGYRFLGRFYHPHNSYISIFYDGGVFAVLFFLAFVLAFFGATLRGRGRWLLVALVGWGGLITTGSGVLSSPKPYWVYFWIPTFMAILEVRRDALGRYIDSREKSMTLAAWVREYSGRHWS